MTKIKNSGIIVGVNVFFSILVIFLYLFLGDNEYFVKFIFPILVITSIGFMFYYYKIKYKKILNFHLLILLSLYFFSMSRQITFLFGANSYSSIYGFFSLSQYGEAYFYTYICILAFFVGSINKNIGKENNSIIKETDYKRIYKYLKIVFWLLLIPMLFYYFKLIQVSLTYKYGSREFDANITSTRYLINLLRQFGIQALLGIQVLKSYKKIDIPKLYNYIFYFFIVISLLGGSRTEGIGLLLITILLLFNDKRVEENNIKRVIISFIAILGMFIVASLIPFFFEVRKDITNIENLSFSQYLNSNKLILSIHELGGSESPLLIAMNSNQAFMYGRSYIVAIFNTLFNFLPSSIRPDLTFIGPTSLANYYSRLLSLNYGLGFSLVAESYLNFGWLGFVIFFIFGKLYTKFLIKMEKENIKICEFIFVFLLFTMPRRESKDLFTAMLYYLIPFVILFKVWRKDETFSKYNNVNI